MTIVLKSFSWSWTLSAPLLLTFLIGICLLVLPVRADEPADEDLHKADSGYDDLIEPQARYTAAGINFDGSGSSWSTIGGYSTSGMTFANTGGIVLYKAFSNIDNAIATVQASAVTTSALEQAFEKYFAKGGGQNMWYYSSESYDLIRGVNSSVLAQTRALDLFAQFTVGLNNGVVSYPSLRYSNGTFGYATNILSATANISNMIYMAGVETRELLSSSLGAINDRLGASASVYDAQGGSHGSNSIQSSLGFISKLIYDTATTGPGGYHYLSDTGQVAYGSNLTSPNLLGQGLLGLSFLMSGEDRSTTFSLLSPNDEVDPATGKPVGGLKTEEKQVDNLLDALGLLGSSLQNPLAKLAYIWADDDDIRIADKNQPVKDAIEDNFVGDGPGAVKPSDIGDVADFGSDLKDAFSGAGSPGDIWAVMGDANVFRFFSEEVARDLDQTGSPAVVDVDSVVDGYMNAYYVGDDGFVHSSSPSSSDWDVSAYLEGLR